MKRGSPRISIVIPCFNMARYLSEAIESALAQTLPAYEVLLIDYGSTDETPSVVSRFGQRVRCKRIAQTSLERAMNVGLESFQGDFVVLLGADDRLKPHYLEKTYSLLSQQRDPHVAYCYTQYETFGADKSVSRFPPFDRELLLEKNFITTTSLLRGDVARQFRYDPQIPRCQDHDFYLSLLEFGFTGVLLDEPLLEYRIHTQSRTWERKLLGLQEDVARFLVEKHKNLYPVTLRQKVLKRARDNTFLGFIETRSPEVPLPLRWKQFIWMLRHYARHVETWRHLAYALGWAPPISKAPSS